jgi:DNA polymerase-4
MDAVLLGLVDRVTRRMRGAKRVGRTVVLRLRFDDFSRATRSSTLEQATAQTKTVLDTSRALLTTALPIIDRQGLTLIGLSVGNLEDAHRAQLTLPLDSPDRTALDAALDTIRDHYGASAITRATLLGRDSGLEMPCFRTSGATEPPHEPRHEYRHPSGVLQNLPEPEGAAP